MTQYHLIGIGGSGLSAIAVVLLERGYLVSGSDRQLSDLAKMVQEAGGRVHIGHNPENVAGAEIVIRSSAIPDDNVEVQAALDMGVPVLKRADFLGHLMELQTGIAIAGTHGKTTTTAMIAWILAQLDKDPSYIIGGVSKNLQRNAHAGKGEYFVIEADEYDRMFLGLNPQIAVVGNVEHDHPDCYPTEVDYFQAFEDFVNRLMPGGVLIANGDDPGAQSLLDKAAANGVITKSYGIGEHDHDLWADNLISNPQSGSSFTVHWKDPVTAPTSVSLRAPGEHNIQNAMAAMAVSDYLELPLDAAARALGEFEGTGRRFEVRGEQAGTIVVDDYAHHPTEIKATIAAARARYPDHRIWAVWQPHTYSRTRTLLDGFVKAFDEADQVLVTDIFAAREMPPADGFSTNQVVEALKNVKNGSLVHFSAELHDAKDFLLTQVRPGDVVLVLSAGDADKISTQLLDGLSMREPAAVKQDQVD